MTTDGRTLATTGANDRCTCAGLAGTVRCGCFGSADDAPVTGVTLLRNALLLGVSAAAAGTTKLHLGLPGVLAIGTAALVGVVLLALGDLRVTTGHLFPRATEPGLREPGLSEPGLRDPGSTQPGSAQLDLAARS